MIKQVAGVDEDTGLVYFTGTCDSLSRTHLYSVCLDCTQLLEEPKRLIEQASGHILVLDYKMKSLSTFTIA